MELWDRPLGDTTRYDFKVQTNRSLHDMSVGGWRVVRVCPRSGVVIDSVGWGHTTDALNAEIRDLYARQEQFLVATGETRTPSLTAEA